MFFDFIPAPVPATQDLETNHWPFGDVNVLFQHFNEAFFDNCLSNVVVRWSSRLTRSAGMCKYRGTRSEEHGPIIILLSEALLQYRSQHDLLDVLVHEMIHAYLFRLKIFERLPHGPIWQAQAERINVATGLTIRAYHNYFREVQYLSRKRTKCQSIIIDHPVIIDLTESVIDLTES